MCAGVSTHNHGTIISSWHDFGVNVFLHMYQTVKIGFQVFSTNIFLFPSTTLSAHSAFPPSVPCICCSFLLERPPMCLTRLETLITADHALNLRSDGRSSGNPSLPTFLLLGLRCLSSTSHSTLSICTESVLMLYHNS